MDRTEVDRILTEAREAVDAAQLPPDLRVLGFEKAVDLLSGDVPSNTTNGGVKNDGDVPPVDDRLAAIARRLGVDTAKLAYVYDLDDDDATFVIQRSKLSSTKADATREVGLLYAAARQAGGYDETHTAVAKIRSKVEDMGVLDPNNFASQMTSIEGVTSRGATAQSREFKVTQHAYENAGKLVERLTGGSGS